MSKRKTRAAPEVKRFETDNAKGGFVRIYSDMLFSNAWNNLTPAAKNLYLFCLYARFHQTKTEKQYLAEKYGNDDFDYFFFNESRFIIQDKRDSMHYGIYSKGNGKLFRRDRDLLITNGFIEIVEQNKHRMQKNVYKLSAKWKEIKEV